ncbi:MAG: hypothetical protein ACNA8W_17160, partial [Bradymonadaceae bacterium]
VDTKDDNDRFEKLLEEKGLEVERDGLKLKIHLSDGQDEATVLRIAVDGGIQLRHFMPAELTLETAFLSLLDDHDAGTQAAAIAEEAS